jgi:hypothetical protein
MRTKPEDAGAGCGVSAAAGVGAGWDVGAAAGVGAGWDVGAAADFVCVTTRYVNSALPTVFRPTSTLFVSVFPSPYVIVTV